MRVGGRTGRRSTSGTRPRIRLGGRFPEAAARAALRRGVRCSRELEGVRLQLAALHQEFDEHVDRRALRQPPAAALCRQEGADLAQLEHLLGLRSKKRKDVRLGDLEA